MDDATRSWLSGLLLALSACTTDAPCGPSPLAPGWSVATDGDRVTMSRSDYEAIVSWRDAVTEWAGCAEVGQ
jgi:hypothetical protein